MNPRFRQLTLSDKEYYNGFYYAHGVPCSDYCFSVIQTWLVYGGPVEVAELASDLLLIKYADVLDVGTSVGHYTLIGNGASISREHIDYLASLVDDSTKIVVTEPHYEIFRGLLSDGVVLSEELGLNDYIYSVSEYSTLDQPRYRNVRRKISAFKKHHGEKIVKIESMDIGDIYNAKLLINAHHTWDKTFQYGNDPDRTEGIILGKSILQAKELDLYCKVIWVDSVLSGFFIYTRVDMEDARYADVHHARFSYEHINISYLGFHLLAKGLSPLGYDYINFERDADLEGLRHHKMLKKPVRIIRNYSLLLT